MSDFGSSSNLHERLDEFEMRVREKISDLSKSGPIASEQQKRIDEIQARANAMKQKLQSAQESTWKTAKHDLQIEWDTLIHAFEHWVEQVEEKYRHPRR